MGTEETTSLSRSPTEISLLDLTVLVVARKRFISRFVLGSALLAILLAFVLPVRYEANIVLMPPAQSSSMAGALLGQIGNLGALGSLGSLAGGLGVKTPTEMYVSLLKSRTVEDAMIRRFGLMTEYHQKKMSGTRKALENHLTVAAGVKDGLIRIAVEDGDP